MEDNRKRRKWISGRNKFEIWALIRRRIDDSHRNLRALGARIVPETCWRNLVRRYLRTTVNENKKTLIRQTHLRVFVLSPCPVLAQTPHILTRPPFLFCGCRRSSCLADSPISFDSCAMWPSQWRAMASGFTRRSREVIPKSNRRETT